MPDPRAVVLVVEDDPDVGALLRHQLESLGCLVTHVLTAEDGLVSAHSHPPDLAVVDMLLPGLDGRDFVAALRSRPDTSGCRVIVSSVLDPDAIDFPVDAVITKPFRRRDVAAALDAAGYGSGDGSST